MQQETKNEPQSQYLRYFGIAASVTGFFLLISGIFLLFTRENYLTTNRIIILISIALILMFYQKIENFELPFLKIKIKETLNEAEEIIAKLKSISIPLAQCSLTSLISAGGTIHGLIEDKLNILGEIVEQLRSLGIKENDIFLARKFFDQLICEDIAIPIISYIHHLLKEKKHTLLLIEQQKTQDKEPIKTDDHLAQIAEIDKDIRQLGELTCRSKHEISISEKMDCFLSSTKYISKEESIKIKDQFNIDLENLKSYEKDGEFHDKNHYINRYKVM